MLVKQNVIRYVRVLCFVLIHFATCLLFKLYSPFFVCNPFLMNSLSSNKQLETASLNVVFIFYIVYIYITFTTNVSEKIIFNRRVFDL